MEPRVEAQPFFMKTWFLATAVIGSCVIAWGLAAVIRMNTVAAPDVAHATADHELPASGSEMTVHSKHSSEQLAKEGE